MTELNWREGNFAEAMKLFEDAAEGMEANIIVNLNAARTFLMHMEQSGPSEELTKKLIKYLKRAHKIDPTNRALMKLQRRTNKLLGVTEREEV